MRAIMRFKEFLKIGTAAAVVTAGAAETVHAQVGKPGSRDRPSPAGPERAGAKIQQLQHKVSVSAEVRKEIGPALASADAFRTYLKTRGLNTFGESSEKNIEIAAAAYDVLKTRTPRPYRQHPDLTDVGTLAQEASRLVAYSRADDATPVLLGLATLHDRIDTFSALSRLSWLLKSRERTQPRAREARSDAVRPLDHGEYDNAWLAIAKKFGTKDRGDFYHALNHNFISEGFMSPAKLEAIFNRSFEMKLMSRETHDTVYKKFLATEDKARARFFHSSFWESLTRGERLPVLKGFLSSPSRNYDELYPIFFERWRWRPHISNQDWNELLKPFGAQDPDKALYYLWDNDQKVQPDEEAIAARWFVDARWPITRVDFLQKGLSHGGSHLLDQFARLILDTRPAELLVLQNAKPKVAPLDSMPVRFGADTIFQDEALAGITLIKTELLPRDIQSLRPVEIAHWKAWVARNLYFAGTSATPETATKEVVARAIKDIQEARVRIGSMPIFKGADVIVGMHEELRKGGERRGEPRFATPDFIAGLKRQASRVDVISPHLDLKNKDYRVTPDSLKQAKENILNRIVTCGSPSTFCVFFPEMHGGTEHDGQGGSIFLSDGQVNNIITEPDKTRQVVRTERTLEITAEEIANAYLDRYANDEKRASAHINPDWIVFASCVSSNIGRRIADIILEKGGERGIVPPHMLFMSEWGQPGFSEFYDPIGHDFGSSTLGLGEKGPIVTTVQRVIERAPRQYKSRPGILIPKILDGKPVLGPNGRPIMMQIGNLRDGTRAVG